jgi:hypothetical protein
LIEKLKEKDGMLVDEEGCSWDSYKSYIECEVLGFCGCGNPDEILEYTKVMLGKLKNQEWGEYSDHPYMFFVYWANEKGFAEHGSTARCSWLTELGEEILRDIKTVGKEDDIAI